MGLGEDAVRYARECVCCEVTHRSPGEPPEDPGFSEERGVFVTLNTYPSGELRGCIGYPYPVFSLAEAIRNSAGSACHDPRFPDLGADELDGVTVEVTVLSQPEVLVARTADELADSVVVGRDGLMIECRGMRGLLLPQVPVEWGWDSRTYLEHLSVKAGLPKEAWTWEDARFRRFTGDVYSEETPGGSVSRRDF